MAGKGLRKYTVFLVLSSGLYYTFILEGKYFWVERILESSPQIGVEQRIL